MTEEVANAYLPIILVTGVGDEMLIHASHRILS